MAIEIIRFNSYLLDPASEITDQIASAAKEHSGEAQLLEAGEYDITPEYWLEVPHVLNLLVHPDGTGTYRMIPRDKSPEALDAANRLGRGIPRGEIFAIPQVRPMIVITGLYRNSGYRSIEEIIV